jgi:HAD superfamily hydrolase (TIGR01459 family)
LQHLSASHPIWFCDIWGVVHNGFAPFAETVACLVQHRRNGGIVILVSNSPRSEKGVALQLTELGVAPESYDAIVTSGDVTQDLMRRIGDGKLFHLGAARDLSLFEGMGVERVPPDQASAIICTGLFHDERETPEDYIVLLTDLLKRGLPMICANPDKIVRKGDRLQYCAGALAEVYAAMGGKVAMAGKPFAPIYELALQKAERLRGKTISVSEVLAIGDGPETDILGAANQGFDCVYVSGGVRDHVEDMAAELAHIRIAVPLANILLATDALHWT